MGSRVRIRHFDILHFVRDLLFPLLKSSKSGSHMVHIPNLWGVSGSEDRVGDDNSIQIINIGRVDDKSFIEFLKKWGGEWQQYFDFSYITGSMKNASSKNCILGYFFYSYEHSQKIF